MILNGSLFITPGLQHPLGLPFFLFLGKPGWEVLGSISSTKPFWNDWCLSLHGWRYEGGIPGCAASKIPLSIVEGRLDWPFIRLLQFYSYCPDGFFRHTTANAGLADSNGNGIVFGGLETRLVLFGRKRSKRKLPCSEFLLLIFNISRLYCTKSLFGWKLICCSMHEKTWTSVRLSQYKPN